jgi:hypothetical protein
MHPRTTYDAGPTNWQPGLPSVSGELDGLSSLARSRAVRHVVTDCASDRRPGDRMMAREVAAYGAYSSALQTSLGVRGLGEGEARNCNCDCQDDGAHLFLPRSNVKLRGRRSSRISPADPDGAPPSASSKPGGGA